MIQNIKALSQYGIIGKEYPYMAKIARAIMILPHTSVPVERVFGALKDFKSSKRNRLTTENLEASLLLYQKFGDADFNVNDDMLKLYDDMWTEKEHDIDSETDTAIKPNETGNTSQSVQTSILPSDLVSVLRNVNAHDFIATILNPQQNPQTTTSTSNRLREGENDVILYKRQLPEEKDEKKSEESRLKNFLRQNKTSENPETNKNPDPIEIIYSKEPHAYEVKNENTSKRRAKEPLNQQKYNEQVKATKNERDKEKLEKVKAKEKAQSKPKSKSKSKTNKKKNKNKNKAKDQNEMEIEIENMSADDSDNESEDQNEKKGNGKGESSSRGRGRGRSKSKGKKEEKVTVVEKVKGKRKSVDEDKSKGKSIDGKSKSNGGSPEKEKIKVNQNGKANRKSPEKEKTPAKRRK